MEDIGTNINSPTLNFFFGAPGTQNRLKISGVFNVTLTHCPLENNDAI